MTDSTRSEETPAGVDTTVPSSPRIWNYWLGGNDNFSSSRTARTSSTTTLSLRPSTSGTASAHWPTTYGPPTSWPAALTG